jgi:drug/metabolite transporter (DMT)-like permease
MTTESPQTTSLRLTDRTTEDWVLLSLLTVMFGSSFLFITLAAREVPPMTMAAMRLILAAVLLNIAVRVMRLPLPPLRTPAGGVAMVWPIFLAIAFVGNIIPFALIAWGQQTVPSALAGILISIMPLATMLLAHLFVAGERMTARGAAGFVIGFGGIIVLMGPQALGAMGEAPVLAQLAVLGGALCYAVNTVIARFVPLSVHPLSAAGTVSALAAAFAIPLALIFEKPFDITPSATALMAVAVLGIFPTGLAAIVYFRLVRTAGPTFLSLVNYLTPLVAVGLGVLILAERLAPNAYLALALILGGIALSQLRIRR